MNLSVRQLRAFVAIARLHSFTRAAEQLHITQPGLSAMVRDLEEQLDCRLFERTTRTVGLTSHGEAFLPVASRVLADLDTAAASLGHLSSLERRRLAVGATPVIASSILPAACAEFATAHPGVRVDVHDLDRAQIHAHVQDGRLDAGFGVFLDAASGLRRLPLLKTALVLVTPAGDAAAGTVRWSDLKRERLLGLPAHNPIQQLVDAHVHGEGRTADSAPTFNQLHTLLAMVEAGAGDAVLPSFVTPAAGRYRVAVRPIVRPKVPVEFYEITKAGRPRGDLLMQFGDCLVRTMKAFGVMAV
ncbi:MULTISPECIES: LysR family transcriptional regulator [Ramlibacter]|nr:MULTISPECIES: LysR family transcriptional regulator [Ramlibacter]MBA2962337.1 LysR family transcriptional regulator [Ramlibacter sp. CGMCC 1.13660]